MIELKNASKKIENNDINLLHSLIKKQKTNYDKNSIILSIIVPVYNVENYLRKCLDSLSNQLVENIEIICINDGSSDLSPIILREYKEKDYRIKVINTENKGLSAARNKGLEIAKGKYIGFVDSDDYVSVEMYDALIKFLEKNNLDIACCNFYHLVNNEKYINDYNETEELIINDRINTIKEYLIDDKIKNYVWQKIYKREIFTDIRFPEGKNYEDIAISINICEKINRIGYIGKPLYYYNYREGSISKSNDFRRIIDSVNNSFERYKYIKSKYNELNNYNVISMLNRIITEYDENQITEKEFFIIKFKNIINELEKDYKSLNLNDLVIDNFLETIKNDNYKD